MSGMPTLRTTPPLRRWYWKESTAGQLSQVVIDKNSDYLRRTLPGNEVTVLALNEIACVHRRGFFLHLPSREVWKTVADPDRLPRARVPAAPSGFYPSMVYMDLVWDKDIDTFANDSHRARYLMSSAIMSPPPDCTPMYAIQYVSHQNGLIFSSDPPSLILIATKKTYYLCSTLDYERIFGQKRNNAGKLTLAPYLWNELLLQQGKDQAIRRQNMAAMAPFAISTLEEACLALARRCSPRSEDLQPTFSAAALKTVVPRADRVAAASVGSTLGEGTTSEPPSRRGERKKERAGVSREDNSVIE